MSETVEFGFLSAVPILVLIIGVIITKKIVEMLILSTLIGAIIIYKTGFFSGAIELIYGTLSNGSYQFLFLILIFCGPMIVLYEKSGSMLGFSGIIRKIAKKPRSSMLMTWILGVIVFIDDYLNALAVAASMRSITDKLKIPREHLAFTVNSTGSCVCVLIPFSSWAAFSIGVMGEYDYGFSDYLAAVPFMFYCWAAIAISLLLGIGVLPKVGALKKAYQRVESGGPTAAPKDEKGAVAIVNIEAVEDAKPANPINFLIPMAGLIATMIYFDGDMIHGLIVAIVLQGILYLAQRILTLTQLFNSILEGVTNMANLIFTCVFCFTVAGINEELGFAEYMIGIFTTYITPAILPAFTFLLIALIAFASGTFWALIVIASPIFIPMGQQLGINPMILIAGIVSGTALGSQCCFYSDAVFMTAAGTGVAPVTQVRVAAPYILVGVVVAVIGYLIAGFAM
jgi:Na+/H+ antiporter NhaC